ncbi:12767_t:CDS:1, partial [Rhizophagus irregularis]
MTDQFDFSDYFIDYSNSLGNRREKIAENTKVSELFKDECNDIIIAEFISLRPKMYSILKVEDDITNPKYRISKVKGIPLKVVKKEFHYEQYNRILFDPNHMDK